MATATYVTSGTTTGPIDYWRQWNNTSATAAGILIEPWRTWTATTSTTLNTTTYTWQRWQEPAPRALKSDHVHLDPWREATQAELDAAQRRREEASARRLADQQRWTVAQTRALELLRSLLTPNQLRDLEANEEIRVQGSDGGLYVIEIQDGRVHGNIRAVDEHGCSLGRLCVQPRMFDPADGVLPGADGHVGQLLAIRFNEAALLDKANWSFRRPCQQPNGLRAA